MVAGGFAILVSAWKVASVRRFLIAILGMQAAFACLYATTVGIVPLVAGIAGTLILAAIVAAFGSHRLPLAYPASFAFAGYLIVTLGLVFWCYLAWLLFVQDAGFLSDYLLLFLSTALALYAAPSAGSFRIVAAVLGAPLIFVLIRDLGVAPEALRVDAEGGLVNLLGRMKLYSGLFCFFSVFILLYLVGQTRRTH